MNARLLYSKFWGDGFISKLTPIQKLIFIYYLTNESVNIIYLYELPTKKVLYDTGLDSVENGLQILQETKELIQQKGSMYFIDDYVYLANAEKYEPNTGDKFLKGRANAVKQVNKKIKAWYKEITGRELDAVVPNTKKNETPAKTIKKGQKPTIKKVRPTASIDYLRNLKDTPEILKKYAEKYKVSNEYVLKEAEKVINYCKRTGKKYKDYGACLDTFISGDLEKETPKKAFTGENVAKYNGL